jgi:hypothetical protein
MGKERNDNAGLTADGTPANEETAADGLRCADDFPASAPNEVNCIAQGP